MLRVKTDKYACGNCVCVYHRHRHGVWIKKCGSLTMKRGKIVKSEGIKLPDGEVMKQVGQEGYTYLGIIELDKIKETEMKEKITKEYKRRKRLS